MPATFTGTLDRASRKLAGEVTLGGGGPGQLPQHGTSYTVTGTLVGPAP